MTCPGSPSVYRIGDILVITPVRTEHILEGMGFEKAFDFWGTWRGITIRDKKTMFFDDLFGESRMARLARIAMDIDIPYREYLIKCVNDKKERAKILRKTKIIAARNMIIKPENKLNLACAKDQCGRRFRWRTWVPGSLTGYCPRCYGDIILKETEGGDYKITKLEIKK